MLTWVTVLCSLFLFHLRYFKKISYALNKFRWIPRTLATFKIRGFFTLVNDFQSLTYVTRSSNLDVVEVLDMTLKLSI